MLEMVKRLLLEADLEDELSKLGVYGKTIEGIKEFLNYLLKDPQTGTFSLELFCFQNSHIKVQRLRKFV